MPYTIGVSILIWTHVMSNIVGLKKKTNLKSKTKKAVTIKMGYKICTRYSGNSNQFVIDPKLDNESYKNKE